MEIRELQHTPKSQVSGAGRDRFLDAIRTVATVRVVLWHTFGLPVLSYLVAAMPAMFFVFGALLAKSVDRHGVVGVLRGRLRRTLIPLWFFAATVWIAAAVFSSSFELATIRHATLWFIPLDDPHAMPWEGGWLSSPLWFMRTLFWLLLTSPVWLFAIRKAPKATAVAAIAAVFGLDAAQRTSALAVDSHPMFWWKLGDLALYGMFAAFGAASFHFADRISQVRARTWLCISALAAAGAAAWLSTHTVHLGVVNNSHPLHMFVGAAWLSLAFAARPHISAFANKPLASHLIATVNRRAMTIYLWHTVVIAGSVWVLSRVGFVNTWNEPILTLVVVFTGIAIAVMTFGWVEDFAAGKRDFRLPTLRLPTGETAKPALLGTAAAMTALLVGTAVLSPATPQASRMPPIPSQQPPAPQFVSEEEATSIDMSQLPQGEVEARIQQLLADWRDQHPGRGAFVAATSIEDLNFEAAGGVQRSTDEPIAVGDTFDMASITKMLTASVVLRLADLGYINLDAPLPELTAVPEFAYNEILTPRMLLTHRSGLVNYRDTEVYKTDLNSVASPVDAIRASSSQPLTAPPGTVTQYSSTNFLVLGLLVEQVTGRDFDDILREQVLDPAGMSHTRSLPSSPGEPSGATAGTDTTMYDLLRMTRSILHERRFTSDAGYQTMLNVDPESAIGAGAIGFCPCYQKPDGTKVFRSYGHFGGDTIVIYVPATGAIVGFHSTESIHEDRFESVVGLVNEVANLTARAVPDTSVV